MYKFLHVLFRRITYNLYSILKLSFYSILKFVMEKARSEGKSKRLINARKGINKIGNRVDA